MNEKLHNWINPLIAIVFLIIVGVAGYFFTTRDRMTDDLLTVTNTTDQLAKVDSDLLTTLGKLKKMELDDSIFRDPVWRSLNDFGQVLLPEPKSRSNPFAPLSAD